MTDKLPPAATIYTISTFKTVDGQWRWRMKAPNGEIVADSAESYTRKPDVKRAAKALQAAVIVVSDE